MMNKFVLYHVDTFTDKVFCGNPAAVCSLQQWLSDEILHMIAKENNLPITAFVMRKDQHFEIRWITPEYEIDLCGHGSLAAGYVIFNEIEPTLQQIDLQSRHERLTIMRQGEFITLNFLAKNIEICSLSLPKEALGYLPKEIYQHKNERCFVILDSEEDVKQLMPDMQTLKKIPHRGITITAPGTSCDFVSRTFYPHKTVPEDPVTGAAHCLLVPYWSNRLHKTTLQAKQISQRGGEILCQYEGDRVLLSGKAVLYMKGEGYLDLV